MNLRRAELVKQRLGVPLALPQPFDEVPPRRSIVQQSVRGKDPGEVTGTYGESLATDHHRLGKRDAPLLRGRQEAQR